MLGVEGSLDVAVTAATAHGRLPSVLYGNQQARLLGHLTLRAQFFGDVPLNAIHGTGAAFPDGEGPMVAGPTIVLPSMHSEAEALFTAHYLLCHAPACVSVTIGGCEIPVAELRDGSPDAFRVRTASAADLAFIAELFAVFELKAPPGNQAGD